MHCEHSPLDRHGCPFHGADLACPGCPHGLPPERCASLVHGACEACPFEYATCAGAERRGAAQGAAMQAQPSLFDWQEG